MIKWFMKETDTPKYKVTFSLAIQCFYHTICRPNSVRIFTVLQTTEAKCNKAAKHETQLFSIQLNRKFYFSTALVSLNTGWTGSTMVTEQYCEPMTTAY